MKKMKRYLVAVGFAMTIGASAPEESAAQAKQASLRVAPDRLRVSTGDEHKPAAFVVTNPGVSPVLIERFVMPRSLTARITTFRESSGRRLLVRDASTEGRFRRLDNGRFALQPGGMLVVEVRARIGAKVGRLAGALEVRDPSGRLRKQPITVFAYELLHPAKCQTSRDTCFVALGDHGTGDANQKRVASALRTLHRRSRSPGGLRIDFVVGLGDNFYPTGLTLFNRKKRFREWEQIYAGINTKFYMTLGNHDHYGDWRNQMRYMKCTKRWCSESWNTKRWIMPSNYYSFRKGDVEFFAIDSPRLDSRLAGRGFALSGMNTMLSWLEASLKRSTAKWKVVYGHHPVFNYSPSHGDELESLTERLLPLLVKYKVDIVLGGHEHDQQHIRRPSFGGLRGMNNIDFIVSGSAGKSNNNSVKGRFSKFADASLGFAHLAISGDRLTLRFVKAESNGTPKVIYQTTRVKEDKWRYRRPPPPVRVPVRGLPTKR